MKRLLVFISILKAIFIINCESEKMIPGESGSPVYLVPEIEQSSDTLGCTFSWSFTERPLQSNLSILSFQPSSNGYNIYFIPDVPGDYRVKCEVLTPDKKLKNETVFLCKIKGDGNPTPPRQESQTDTSADIAEAEPIYLEDEISTQQSTPEAIKKDPKQKNTPQHVETKPDLQKPVEEGIYTIQISSFKAFPNAEREMKDLKSMGLDDVYIKRVYIKSLDQTWFRVRTNSFHDRATAREKLSIIKNKYKRSSAWIDKIN